MNPEIIDALDRAYNGYAILFVGSGFSAYAQNADNEFLPTGSKLASLLKKHAGFLTDYPLDVLSREYVEKFGEHGLLDLLQTKLTAKSVSGSQELILSLPWRRIYTTNYDNVIELCAKGINKKVAPADLRDDANHSRSVTQCVHLNGRLASVSLANFLQEIKLTRASYLTDTFLSTGWLATFRNDLSLATSVFFIGYSMYDIDVARIVYEDPTLKAKTFFIDASDLDPVMSRELGQFGFVFPVGLNRFAELCAAHKPPVQQKRAFTAFKEFVAPESTEVAKGDDVLSLLIRGEIRDELIPATSTGTAKYLVNRAAVAEVLERIKSGAKRFLIHADLGNGKTTLVHLLRFRLAQQGLTVLELKQTFDTADEDIRLIATAQSQDVVFIEDIYRNSEIVRKLCFAAPNAIVIATARSSTFDLRNNEVEEIFDGEFFEQDINQLHNSERRELSQLATENGLWGELSARSAHAKDDFILKNCGNELRSFLIHLLESPSFKERIKSSFYSATDQEILVGIALILFLDVANFDPDLFVVSQLTGIDFLKVSRLKKNPIAREYLEFNSGKVRVKSAILAQFILREVFDYDVSLKFLIKAVRACETAKSQNKFFGDIQKELMKFSFIDRIFARTKDTRHYVTFYDALKTLPSMSRNPQFWLQYAIARLEHSEFKSADTLFRTAYSHAHSITNYNPFQIDNHFARYLLVSRTNDRTYQDYFRAFTEAHGLLMKQARTEPNAYYPFKVARFYKEFVRQNLDRLVPEQISAIGASVKQMIAQIDKGSRHIMRYRLVQECRLDLADAAQVLSDDRK